MAGLKAGPTEMLKAMAGLKAGTTEMTKAMAGLKAGTTEMTRAGTTEMVKAMAGLKAGTTEMTKAGTEMTRAAVELRWRRPSGRPHRDDEGGGGTSVAPAFRPASKSSRAR